MRKSILTALAIAACMPGVQVATDKPASRGRMGSYRKHSKKKRKEPAVDPVRIQAATDKRERKNAKRLRDNMPNP
tara:strand:- start:734 stop:958 length:225 start_codon:yes stop_codon:yes gene_type:complete